MIRKIGLACLVWLLAAGTVAAATLTLSSEPIQGGLVQARTEPGARVTLDGKDIPVAKSGLFVFGFGRDAGRTASLVVRLPNGKNERRQLAVKQRTYKIQRIDGLPDSKVSPKKRDMKRIGAERDQLRAARRVMSKEPRFAGGFMWPVKGRLSGIFGSQRVLNGEPRRPHFGVDIAAPAGTPIVAAADGRVVLVHQDMFFTGKTVVIEHGLGVSTLYIHMSAIEVKKGDLVRRGQTIGRIGMTGRATGPHLHWGLTWRGLNLDPALLVGPMPKMAAKKK
ncbi:MAG: M23 family metallopeptidase [Proteobacteria bacterium]|nr:M23 family metallopeptidase [Pseudomonadota bacterium]